MLVTNELLYTDLTFSIIIAKTTVIEQNPIWYVYYSYNSKITNDRLRKTPDSDWMKLESIYFIYNRIFDSNVITYLFKIDFYLSADCSGVGDK